MNITERSTIAEFVTGATAHRVMARITDYCRKTQEAPSPEKIRTFMEQERRAVLAGLTNIALGAE